MSGSKRTKRLLSAILALAMLLSAAPASVLASAATEIIQPESPYGKIEVIPPEDYAFTVDTTVTQDVIRVAKSKTQPFFTGTQIIRATPSGVPEHTGELQNTAYSGEAPAWPKIKFKIIGRAPDSIPTISAASGVTGAIFSAATRTGNETEGYVYTWELQGGTATGGTNAVFEITYKINTIDFKAYACSRVENVLRIPGFISTFYWDKGDYGYGVAGQYQSRNMYVENMPDGANVGFLDYAAAAQYPVGGGAYTGCGWKRSNEALPTDINAHTFPKAKSVEGGFGALSKGAAESSQAGKSKLVLRRNFNYEHDVPSANISIYLDKGRGENLRGVNFRSNSFVVDTGSTNEGEGIRPEGNGVYLYNGRYELGGNKDLPAEAHDANASPANGAELSFDFTTDRDLKNVRGAGWAVNYSGDGPTLASASNASGDLSKEYSVYWDSWARSESNGWTLYHRTPMKTANRVFLKVHVYDKTDLKSLIDKAEAGAPGDSFVVNSARWDYGHSSSTPAVNVSVGSFNKGAHIQSCAYSSETWAAYKAAYQTALSVWARPDTTQKEINDAVEGLVNAYNGLSGHNDPVEIEVHYCKSGNNVDIIPPLTSYSRPAGSIIKVYPADIPGYTSEISSTDNILLCGNTSPVTVTIHYRPEYMTVYGYGETGTIAETSTTVLTDDTFLPSSLQELTKEGYVQDGWNLYIKLGESAPWTAGSSSFQLTDGQRIPDEGFIMPAHAVNLVARWVIAPIGVWRQDVVDGVVTGEAVAAAPPTAGFASNDAEYTEPYEPNPYPPDKSATVKFTNYYKTPDLSELAEFPVTFPRGSRDVTYYAKFVDVSGKVAFELNGGDPDPAFNDVSVSSGTVVNEPGVVPHRAGYDFGGWYYSHPDRDPDARPISWPVTISDAGFVAYAKWTKAQIKLIFDPKLNEPPGRVPDSFDTTFDYLNTPDVLVEVGSAPNDAVIPATPPTTVGEKIRPRKFGYRFSGWYYKDENNVETAADLSAPLPIRDYFGENGRELNLYAKWTYDDASAFIRLDAYERSAGSISPTDGLGYAGDSIIFRMSTKTNFFTGVSAFVFMYDQTFFEPVFPNGANLIAQHAVKLNRDGYEVGVKGNDYVDGLDAEGGAELYCADAGSVWPENLLPRDPDMKAILVTVDMTNPVSHTQAMASGDPANWLFEFQLKIKEGLTAPASGRVWMDASWTASRDPAHLNPRGRMRYEWTAASVPANSAYPNSPNPYKAYPNTDLADATIELQERPPEVSITLKTLQGEGEFQGAGDANERTYTGTPDAYITELDEEKPVRPGYSLDYWYSENDENVHWTPEGYYPPEGTAPTPVYVAHWSAAPQPIKFNANGGTFPDPASAVPGAAHTASLVTLNVNTGEPIETLYNQYFIDANLPVRPGYTLSGWIKDGGADLIPLVGAGAALGVAEYLGASYTADWTPDENSPFVIDVYIPDYNNSYGDEPTQSFSGEDYDLYTGSTGDEINIVETLPDPQEEGVKYLTYDQLPNGSAEGAPGVADFDDDDYANYNFAPDLSSGELTGHIIEVDSTGPITHVKLYYRGAPRTYIFSPEDSDESHVVVDHDPEGNLVHNNVFLSNDATVIQENGQNIQTRTGFYNRPINNLPKPANGFHPTKYGYEFGGWNWHGAGVNQSQNERFAGTSEEPYTIKAIYNPKSFPVMFFANGDPDATANDPALFNPGDNTSTVATTQATFGSRASKPANIPQRIGYAFKGWSANENIGFAGLTDEQIAALPEGSYWPADAELPIIEDADGIGPFYAVWQIRKITVRYMLDGEAYAEENYEYRETVVIKDDPPSRTGYTFNGWKRVKNGETIPAVNFTLDADEVAPMGPNNVITITGSYTANSYSVKFHANGGAYPNNVDPYEVDVDFDAPIFTPAEYPARTGYEFKGWSETALTWEETNTQQKIDDLIALGTVKAIPVGQEIGTLNYDRDCDYYAVWLPKPITYSVHAYLEKDTLSGYPEQPDIVVNNMTCPAGASLNFDPDVKESFESAYILPSQFVYADPQPPEAITSGTAIPASDTASDLVFKVYYKRAVHYINVESNNNAAPLPQISYQRAFGVALNIDDIAAPTPPDGYSFDGWVDELPATMPAGDFTLYAKIVANLYPVGFYLDAEGTQPHKTENLAFNSVIPKPSVPVKTGYGFDGWARYNDPGAAKVEFNADGPLVQITTPSGRENDFVARWTLLSFDINYHDAEGNVCATVQVPFGTDLSGLSVPNNTSPYACPDPKPTKTGHNLTEWIGFPDDLHMPNDAVDLYPKFDPREYVVHFDLNNVEGDHDQAAFPADTPVEPDGPHAGRYRSVQTFGEPIAAPSFTIERNGYDFVGWSTNPSATTANIGEQTVPDNNDLVFYAVWEAIDVDYTVKIYPQDTDGIYPTDEDDPAIRKYTRSATTGTQVIFDSNDYPITGFTYDGDNSLNVLSATVYGDGSAVLKAYYTRNKYTISFDANAADAAFGSGVQLNEVNQYCSEQYYEADVAAPDVPNVEFLDRPGYSCLGWASTPDADVPDSSLGTVPENGKTFYAVWEATDVGYTVEIYRQNTDGIYPTDENNNMIPAYSSRIGALTGALVTLDPYAEQYLLPGFTYDGENSSNVLSATVCGDGSTVLKACYTRNKYTISFDANAADAAFGSGVQPNEFNQYCSEQYYEADVAAPDVPNVEFLDRPGYVCLGWASTSDANVPDSSLGTVPENGKTFYAVWDATDVNYTIEIHRKKVGESAYDVTSFTETGTTGSLVTFDPRVEPYLQTGFTYDGDNSSNVLSATVCGDGSTVLKAYYNRETYMITFDANGGSYEYEMDPSGPYEFEAAVAAPDDAHSPTRDGHDFIGWADVSDATESNVAFPYTVPSSARTFYAVWRIKTYTLTVVDDFQVPQEVTLGTYSVEYGRIVKDHIGAEAPAKDDYHYHFDYWEKQGSDDSWTRLEDDYAMPSRDLKVRPHYERDLVTLNSSGRTIGVSDPPAPGDERTFVSDQINPGQTPKEYYISGFNYKVTADQLNPGSADRYFSIDGDGRAEIEYVNALYGQKQICGTGTVINVYDNVTNQIVEIYHVVIFGDLNGDSIVSVADVSAADAELAGSPPNWSLDGDPDYNRALTLAADADHNSKFNAEDSELIDAAALFVREIEQQVRVELTQSPSS